MIKNNRSRTNKDKDSILVDVKKLIELYHPVFQRMPKIERLDGAAKELKDALYAMVRDFCIAYFCPEAKEEFIRKMWGDYGVVMACFDLIRKFGIATDKDVYLMAECLVRIEEGIKRWQSYIRKTQKSVSSQD